MEAIKTYLDNVFAAYTQTEEVAALKENMLADLEEKYSALRQSGKSEHEAAYSVIANFGSIEEITAELGLENKNAEADESIFLEQDEAEAYLAKSKSYGVWIGLGVWLIIAGVSTVVAFGGVFIMFAAIAVSVAIFIINASSMSVYASYNETAIRFARDTREKIEKARDEFMRRRTAMIAVGVAAIILGAGAVAALGMGAATALRDDGYASVSIMGITLTGSWPVITIFLNVVGFAVFLFIVASYCGTAYDVLLGKGEYADKKLNKKADKLIGTVSAVYWPLIVVINLFLMFVVDTPNFWVVWPISGVLFGAICGGIYIWAGREKS